MAEKLYVRATKLGFDGMKRIREGELFTVRPELFSEQWMEKVDPPVSKSKLKGRAAASEPLEDENDPESVL